MATPSLDVTTGYDYDPAGLLVTKKWNIGKARYTVTAEYDAVGPKIGANTSFILHHEYGHFGQLLSVSDASTYQEFWRFVSSDALGVFGKAELGNSLFETTIEHPVRKGVLHTIQTSDSKEDLLRNLVVDFDNNLNLRSREDKILGTKEKFQYDGFERLHRWSWKGQAGTRRVRWDYDDVGYLLLRAIEAGPGKDLAYKYNTAVAAPHAVVSTTLGVYEYDSKGNQPAVLEPLCVRSQ